MSGEPSTTIPNDLLGLIVLAITLGVIVLCYVFFTMGREHEERQQAMRRHPSTRSKRASTEYFGRQGVILGGKAYSPDWNLCLKSTHFDNDEHRCDKFAGHSERHRWVQVRPGDRF